MTVQRPDQYIICRDELNYRITADRLKKELGGEQPGAVMAFYQAAAPHGWEQLADSEYTVGGTVKTFVSTDIASPLLSDTGGQLQAVMSSRKVPIPAHSHGFTDDGHNHGSTSPSHNHGVNDPNHSHTGLGGSVGRHTHTTGIGGKKGGSPDQKPWRCRGPKSGDLGVLYNSSAGGGGGTLPSSKTGVTVNNGSGSGATSGAKTNLGIKDSADNSNDFRVKYCNVILCKKK